MKTIEWSKMSPRERDGVVAEALKLTDPDAILPYKMINGEPIWARTPKRKGTETVSLGFPVTCDHFTTRWSGVKKIIAHLKTRWLDDPAAWELAIDVEAGRDTVTIACGVSEKFREVTEDGNVPEALCRCVLRYLEYKLT